MELSDFSRILTHLRKEKGISQKKAAEQLGISQSLLSHYEKGIRECGLLFLVRAADFYGVTVDYILGRSYDKNGSTIAVEDIPDDDAVTRGNVGMKGMLPTLNKKLICNSVSVIMDSLSKINSKTLTNEVSSYLGVSVYKMFRMLYNANPENPQTFFGTDDKCFTYMCDSAMNSSEAAIYKQLVDIANKHPEKLEGIKLDEGSLKQNYPLLSSSLLNLLQNSENKIGARKK